MSRPICKHCRTKWRAERPMMPSKLIPRHAEPPIPRFRTPSPCQRRHAWRRMCLLSHPRSAASRNGARSGPVQSSAATRPDANPRPPAQSEKKAGRRCRRVHGIDCPPVESDANVRTSVGIDRRCAPVALIVSRACSPTACDGAFRTTLPLYVKSHRTRLAARRLTQ
jgi:hypothetical protein